VPKLWSDTIEVHRREVTGAILDATAALIAAHGLASVTMSQIAEKTGIGRATLYKYFPDIDTILTAWHERHVAEHLERLVELRDREGTATERLEAVLHAFAMISHQQHDSELVAMLHRGQHVAEAQRQLLDLVRDLVAEGAKRKELRDDVSPKELASYCLHALTAASALPSKPAVERLVKVTLAGLRRE
jgi:AcrR family transcriptional regulator